MIRNGIEYGMAQAMAEGFDILLTRFRSRQRHTFAKKIQPAVRFGFGGPVEPDKI